MATSHDDVDLYKRIRRQDKEAIELLYDRYEKILYSFLYKMTGDFETAEEALQDVFIKLWRGTGEYDETKGKFRSWLFTVARNSALDILRKKKQSIPLDDSVQIVSDDPPVEANLEWIEEKERIQEAMNRLTGEQKMMIELMYFKGYSQSKISVEYDIPLGTVKSRVRLALRNLKKYLSMEYERRR